MAGKRKDAIQRHGWLDLIEIDGPFLSRPALTEQLDDAWPPKLERQLREQLAAIPDRGQAWGDLASDVDYFLIDILGYESSTANREGPMPRRVTLTHTGEQITHPVYRNDAFPVHAVAHPAKKPGDDVDDPRMVVIAADAVANTPAEFHPAIRSARETRLAAAGWRATPVQRAALAARQLGADIALVTDGYHHLVVWVGSGVTGYGWIRPDRYRLDQRLPEAAVALLKPDRVCSRTDTTTAQLLRISQDKQADLTGALGLQVRRAAEALVNAVSRANRGSEGHLLQGLDPHHVYRGVVTVLMRTVFLLNAEENDLIGGDGLYDQAYAVSTLLDELDDEHHRHQSLLRQRHGAWLRLLAAARAVHDGVDHEQMSVYGYGGGLFDPSRHPFLEGIDPDGKQLDVGVVDDFTVRHALDLLQRLDGQRLSYRAFSVEQIGQVYEHLLDHSARLVPEEAVILGLRGASGAEPEVPLADLEQFGDATESSVRKKLAKWLGDTHDPSSGKGKADKWLKRLEQAPKPATLATLGQACQSNRKLIDRITPFLGLLDVDARGIAKVFVPGDVYVTETSVRRDSGTSYTPPAFAAEIAKHALRHLVYDVELETDEDPDTGLKTPDEILKLKVCDPAVGSGAIIVAAVRYLADRLVQARVEHGDLDASQLNTAATVATSADPYVQARRDVVAQCIYAVDRDPMAVEMTKLSLWLISMAKDKPFTFIDHAIRSGDSLLGLTSLDQLRCLHLDVGQADRRAFESRYPLEFHAYLEMIDAQIAEALGLRAQVRMGDVLGPNDADRRARKSAEADGILADLRLVADSVTATCYRLGNQKKGTTNATLQHRVLPLAASLEGSRAELAEMGGQRPNDATGRFQFFHWALEFPEVLASGGFDVMVGNPPFQAGKKIAKAVGKCYREHLVRYVAGGDKGQDTDLVAYFIRRVDELSSNAGLIATNSVTQGDTWNVGPRRVAQGGAVFSRGVSNRRWPGRDAVGIAFLWWHRAPLAPPVLDGRLVGAITSDLWPEGRLRGRPYDLPHQLERVTAGFELVPNGFLMTKDDVGDLPVAERPLIREAAIGDDINKGFMQYRDQVTIDMTAMDLETAKGFPFALDVLRRRVQDESDRADWWQFRRTKIDLRRTLAGMRECIVMAGTSHAAMPVLCPAGRVYAHSVVVFPWESPSALGILSSTIHRVWVDRYTSTLGTSTRYSPSQCFNNFPHPLGSFDVDVPLVAARTTDLVEFRAGLFTSGASISKLYNGYHDQMNSDSTLTQLRSYHIGLDESVAAAYGWGDLELGHGFHETRYGTYFTVSTDARFEILMRLLELNFAQYASQTGTDLTLITREALTNG